MDSEWIPQAYVTWRARTSNGVVVPARQAGNRFLGSLKGLPIRAQGLFGFKGKCHKLIGKYF
jgi:hypothetical protein